MGEQACEAALFISIENSHSVTDAFIFSGNSAEIKVGKNLGLMYHRAGDAGHVKISLPIQGGGVFGIRIFTPHCEKYI